MPDKRTNQRKKSPRIGRRCTIDLTEAASIEVKRICDVAGITTADCFRYGLLLMRIYTDAHKAEKEVYLQKPDSPEREIVTIPLFMEKSHA